MCMCEVVTVRQIFDDLVSISTPVIQELVADHLH